MDVAVLAEGGDSAEAPPITGGSSKFRLNVNIVIIIILFILFY